MIEVNFYMEYRYNFRNLDHRLWVLSVVRFIRAFGRGSTFVFLPLVLISVFKLSFLFTGLLLGFATLIMSTVQYFAGQWTDKIGRRSILVYSQIPGIFAYLILFYSVANPVYVYLAIGSWYATIVINAVQYPAVQASVADITSVSDRLSGFTAIRLMANLGIAVGPLVGAYLARFGLQYIFLIASAATAIEVLMLYKLMTETYTPDRTVEKSPVTLKQAYRADRFFIIFILIGILLSFFTRQRGSSLTVYAVVLQNLPFMYLGYIWALNGFLVVILQLPALRVMTKWSNPIFWRGIGVAFYALSFTTLSLVPTLGVLLLSMTISTVGEDFVSPTTQAIVTTIAPGHLKGSYIGIYNLITSAGSFSGALVGLWMLYVLRSVSSDYWNYIAIGTLAVAIMFISLTAAYRKRFSQPDVKETSMSGANV